MCCSQGVKTLELETDYASQDWSLRLPYDNFVLTLGRTAGGEGALFEQRVGEGHVLLSAGIPVHQPCVRQCRQLAGCSPTSSAPACRGWNGVVRRPAPSLSASYNPSRFYEDPRLYKTMFIVLGLWLVWVLGSTRLRRPPSSTHDPSEAELVLRAGGLIARTVAPARAALRLFDLFFAGVARAARRAGGGASNAATSGSGSSGTPRSCRRSSID